MGDSVEARIVLVATDVRGSAAKHEFLRGARWSVERSPLQFRQDSIDSQTPESRLVRPFCGIVYRLPFRRYTTNLVKLAASVFGLGHVDA